MKTVNLAQAKAKLSELVEQAAQGETVEITRRGKPVAQIVGLPLKRKPIDVNVLRRLTENMTMQEQPAGEFVRAMRDSERY